MTNREWLNNLSNEELARFVVNASVCDCCSGIDFCNVEDDGCEKHLREWLSKERKVDLKAGQVRKNNGVLILIASVREDSCIVVSEMGAVVKISESFASKFEITDITEDEFMRRLFENL